jgi:hypothetical protein
MVRTLKVSIRVVRHLRYSDLDKEHLGGMISYERKERRIRNKNRKGDTYLIYVEDND